LKPVSTSTERALREALTRLIVGHTARTGDRLTCANLAREAGVSRATANRAPAILAELREAEAARLSEVKKPRAPQIDVERNQRELENLTAQHAQVRALLQRASENRRSKFASIRLVEDGR
jgi:aminoglycoside phosphotransferase (APT) family kinase protein